MVKTKKTDVVAVTDERVTARVLSAIKEMIADGTIIPGGRFPPERELAKQLNVNRATLRQVMKLLEIMGALTQRVGDGTYLSASSESIMKEPLELMILIDDIPASELFETRMIIEPEVAARAAQRATSEDLANLRQSIIDLERSHTQQERVNADAAFHDYIFSASGNRIAHLLFRAINRTLLMGMAQTMPRIQVERPLSHHRMIYTAIRDRNEGEARRLMHEHIAEAAEALREAAKP